MGKTATEFFKKEDFLRDSVESGEATNMFNANKLWKKELREKRDCKNLPSKRK